jgi:rubrerythrin
MRLNSLDDIIRFAIRKEADAATMYWIAAEKGNPGIKKIFEDLAREEESHRRRLETFDLKKLDQMEVKETRGLGISEMIEDTPFSPEMSLADLLRMAIKNEEKSQQLYASTARVVTEPALNKLLLVLAQEESKHKEKLEKIYETDILQEF